MSQTFPHRVLLQWLFASLLLLGAPIAVAAQINGDARAAGPSGDEPVAEPRRGDQVSVPGNVAHEPANGLLILSYHDVRDDVATHGDADQNAISTRNFAAHLDWLSGHGYVAVRLADVEAASRGERTLPDKAVLLTFDDGLRSHYTHVFPLLRAYGWPAVMAIVTSWIELSPGQHIDYGHRPFGREDFLTWAQLREMQASGLVEIAAHSHDLHHGVSGNPQGNLTPAATTRIYDSASHRYETESEWRARIDADLHTNAAIIERELGVRPRAIVWPYAAYNEAANALADAVGMPISFDLEGRRQTIPAPGARPGELHGLARLLLSDNPDVSDLAGELRRDFALDGIRAVRVDLDRVYSPDPTQLERNLDMLVDRIHRLGPSHVFLQAFSDQDGDGVADALYFPNRHMPMRADMFSRVAWQLKSRAGVKVFAWMPVLGFVLPDPALRAAGSDNRFQLEPGNAEARALIGDLYEDLAAASYMEGLVFQDEARSGTEPVMSTPPMVALTNELTRRAERWRPKLATVHALRAPAVLDSASDGQFAQALAASLGAYDYTALITTPGPHNGGPAQRLVDFVARQPHGLERTIFELQTVNGRSGIALAGATIAAQMRRLQAAGARHLAYYPDDFMRALPTFEPARAAISARSFPFPPR